jgi:hypothetical protein
MTLQVELYMKQHKVDLMLHCQIADNKYPYVR